MGLPPTVQKYDHDSDALYSARGLTKIYGEGPTSVYALRGVDLNITKSAMVVLLGASGSGESTFLNIIGGLDDATAGQVFFEGTELTSLGPSQLTEYRGNSVSFVVQFYNLPASLTARANVALITEIAEDPITPQEALEMVGLGDRLDHFPSQLSGGEQQRVNVIIDFADPLTARQLLGHSYRVIIKVVEWQGKDLVEAPISALFRNKGQWSVFVMHDGDAKLVPVRIGRMNDERAQILEGLKAGNRSFSTRTKRYKTEPVSGFGRMGRMIKFQQHERGVTGTGKTGAAS
jgi:predicted ABC-type transport system involved in lysophospholipase L1 biosynthesis ATPase subunit